MIGEATIKSYVAFPAWDSYQGKIALNWVRWVALAGMMLDHCGTVLLNGTVYDDVTGLMGITQPLIAFGICWGVSLTGDWQKYLKRVLLLALLSEIPFQLSGLAQGNFNEIWALAFGIMAVKAEDYKKYSGFLFVLLALIAPVSCVLCFLCWVARITKGNDGEYFIFVALVSVLLARFADWTLISWVIAGGLIVTIRGLSLPEIGRNKLLLYAIYPGHLILIAIIGEII